MKQYSFPTWAKEMKSFKAFLYLTSVSALLTSARFWGSIIQPFPTHSLSCAADRWHGRLTQTHNLMLLKSQSSNSSMVTTGQDIARVTQPDFIPSSIPLLSKKRVPATTAVSTQQRCYRLSVCGADRNPAVLRAWTGSAQGRQNKSPSILAPLLIPCALLPRFRCCFGFFGNPGLHFIPHGTASADV